MPTPCHIGFLHISFLLWPRLTPLDMTGPAPVPRRMPGAVLRWLSTQAETACCVTGTASPQAVLPPGPISPSGCSPGRRW